MIISCWKVGIANTRRSIEVYDRPRSFQSMYFVWSFIFTWDVHEKEKGFAKSINNGSHWRFKLEKFSNLKYNLNIILNLLDEDDDNDDEHRKDVVSRKKAWGLGGVNSPIISSLTKPWDPGKGCLGEIANGFLLDAGCTIPVEFDTDSAACIMPHSETPATVPTGH